VNLTHFDNHEKTCTSVLGQYPGFNVGPRAEKLLYNILMIKSNSIMEWCALLQVPFIDILSNGQEVLNSF
jgi:hypothetical protein